MAEKPVCKQKLIEYLKSKRIVTSTIPHACDHLYMYGTGRNGLVDDLLIKLYTGEFDE